MLQVDGDFGACDGADPGADRSPSRCSAILRIEIVPLERAAEAHLLMESSKHIGKIMLIVKDGADAPR